MIKRHKHTFLKSVFLILFWIGCCSASEQGYEFSSINEPKDIQIDSKTRKNIENNHEWLKFLTDINVAFEIAAVHGGDYVAKTEREVQFDALKIGNLHFHFGLREDILFNRSPGQIDHVINYIKTGYEILNGRIAVFWDHTCHNPSRKLEEKKRNDIHWNELGIGYETNGMMLGHKSDSITFNADSKWLNSIQWKASISKIWMRTENDYEWMLEVGTRDDLFRIDRHVLYTQTDLDLIYDHRGINFNSNIEVGDRFHLDEYTYLIGFFAYEHFNDWFDLDYEEDIFSAGLSFEMSLGGKSYWDNFNIKERYITWNPGFSVAGGYANILDNDRYGHSSDFIIDLKLLNLTSNISLGLNTDVGIITIPDDLNPYWSKYQIGPLLRIDLNRYVLDIRYSYSSLYGVEGEKSIRDYQRLALEIKESMWANWDINAGFAAYTSTSGFDYNGEIFGDLTFKLNPEGTSPYVNYSFKYLKGRIDLPGYAIEAGVTILGEKGSCSIYWRQQEDIDIFRFTKGKQTLMGIWFRF